MADLGVCYRTRFNLFTLCLQCCSQFGTLQVMGVTDKNCQHTAPHITILLTPITEDGPQIRERAVFDRCAHAA